MANAESTSVFKLDSKHRYNLISVLLTPVSGDRLRMVKPCWRPTMEDNGAPGGRVDGLLWYKDLGYHAYGEFSMAVIQANSSMEDQSQIESGSLSLTHQGPHGTFVGVYDGHGGPEASRFIRDRFLDNFKTFASQHQEISENVFIKAFAAMEEDFLSLVKKQWLENPQMASVGSCCLVGVICNGFLYIANVGDSRVVLGRAGRGKAGVSAMQLSVEHNANIESIRDELRLMHPCDPQIVVMKHRAWRVKGLIQVSRSIGDAYLKRPEFNREPLPSKFRLPAPFVKPILTWEPSISIQKLHPQDKFLIFASDGLWEHLSNHEAVDIVRNNPRNGIARRLVKVALQEAAKKREMRYSDLKKIDRGVRRHFHDDITVVVVYLDPDLINRVPRCISSGSVSCGVSTSTAIDS